MSITPQPGYIVDPNNPNGVIRDPNIGTGLGGVPDVVTPNSTGSLQGTMTTPPSSSPVPSPIQPSTPTNASPTQPNSNLSSLGLTPEQIQQLNSPQGMKSEDFGNLIGDVKLRMELNNDLMKQRALIVKHLFDSPLTPEEAQQLPQDVQHVLTQGKDAAELQLRIINDQIQGRNNSLASSIGYLTDGYNTSVAKAETERQDAIGNVLNFVQQYGSQAPAAMKSLFGEEYVNRLKSEGIDIEAFSRLSPSVLTQLKPATAASGGTSGTSSGYKFTPTQLNSGAVKAGVSRAEFEKLDPDVQNYFVSSTAGQIQAISDLLLAVQSGTKDIATVKSLIDSSNSTQAVKDYWNTKLSAIVIQNVPTPATGLTGIWNDIKDFLGLGS